MTELTTDRAAEIRRAVDAVPSWYHVMDLGHGIRTPGWFDLSSVVDRLPWPDVRGKRCLDIGTYDGYLAFELERRGASEVVATDIVDHASWDWPPKVRAAKGPEGLAKLVGPEKGLGFPVAREAYRSKVERRMVNIYDLSPTTVGRFDVVLCGSLLLHLRDPFRALEAVRSVCAGVFLSMETVDLWLTMVARRRPVARIYGDELCLWTIPNVSGHRRMLEVAGFDVLETMGPYTIPYGPVHPKPPRSLRGRATFGLQRFMTRNDPGVPHAAVLARPAL